MLKSWGVIGHEWAVSQLSTSLLNGRIRHAYLLLGGEGIGKETLARGFAMALNCLQDDPRQRPCGTCRICQQMHSGNHADILYSQVDANTGVLRIEEVRTATGRLALKPFDARYRVAIFRDFDRAQPRAQDALLKTLEEPAPHAVLVLLAQSRESILPTITSRSQIMSMRPTATEAIRQALVDQFDARDAQAALLAGLSGGRMGWAIRALQDETYLEQRKAGIDLLEDALGKNRVGRFALAEDLSKEKLALIPLLELWQSCWRDMLHVITNTGLPVSNVDRLEGLHHLAAVVTQDEALHALHATQMLLQTLSTNANVRLALEIMLLDYPGLVRETPSASVGG